MRDNFKKIKPFLSKIHILAPPLSLFYFLIDLKRKLTNIIIINSRKAIPILLYHRIDVVSYDPVMLVVNPKTFEEHIKFIVKHYKPISLSELTSKINSKKVQGNEICITFDDGYKDNLINAIPILKKYNIPATIFISTSNIGKKAAFDWDLKYKETDRAYFLSEEEIIECSKNSLIEIGAHTQVCRKIRIDAISNIAPSAVQIFSENDTTIDSLTVDLIQKKINWGDYNKKRTDIKNQSLAKAEDEGERIQNKLDLSHQAELESRQRVLQAIIARAANGSGYDYRQGMRDSQAFTNNAMIQHNNMVDQQKDRWCQVELIL